MTDPSSTHRDESLPGAGAPPANASGNTDAVGKARVFARAKRTAIAVAIAAFATFKLGKWAAVSLWSARDIDPIQDASEWALHHWLLVLLVAAAIFAVVFSITRFVLGKL